MHRSRFLASALATAASALCADLASAQLRIVTMNASNFDSTNPPSPSYYNARAGMGTILSGIGSMVSDDPTTPGNTGIIKRLDVLCLEEVQSGTLTCASYASLLNSIYGTNTYNWGTISGGSTGSGTQGIVYNSAAVSLVNSTAIGTTSTSGMARQELRYQLRPVGYSASADFYIYAGHWKADTGTTNVARRNVEAQTLRADVNTLSAGANVIYLGDMNVYNSGSIGGGETGYQTLTAAGNGQAIDPINKPGNWHNNASFLNVHTQSPFDQNATSATNFTGGGMDDRFDQQVVTANMMDGTGVAYIPNSYQCFGNNGTHGLSQPIDSGTFGDGVPGINGPNLRFYLATILDHLPVVADYQVPAKMSLSVGSVPSQVIVGASVPVNVSISNIAPVSFSIGADKLQYSVNGAGAVSGTGTGTVTALSAAGVSTLSLSTATPGVSSGTVSASSSSQSAGSASLSAPVSTTVLSHATPSFSDSSNENAATIDFGIIARDSTPPAAQSFAVNNLPDASGFTAGLDLDSVNGSGDVAKLATTAAPFSNLAAGAAGAAFEASLIDTSASGAFSAVYTLAMSDQDLPGAAELSPLTLTVTARIALAGDADLSGTVDTVDFNIVAADFGSMPATWGQGDFNHDNSVDTIDFNLLAANFGQIDAAPLGASLIPEPASLAACAAGLLMLRRRRSPTRY